MDNETYRAGRRWSGGHQVGVRAHSDGNGDDGGHCRRQCSRPPGRAGPPGSGPPRAGACSAAPASRGGHQTRAGGLQQRDQLGHQVLGDRSRRPQASPAPERHRRHLEVPALLAAGEVEVQRRHHHRRRFAVEAGRDRLLRLGAAGERSPPQRPGAAGPRHWALPVTWPARHEDDPYWIWTCMTWPGAQVLALGRRDQMVSLVPAATRA